MVVNVNASLALGIVNGISVNTSCLWDAEECDNGTKKFHGEEDPKDTTESDGALVLLVVALWPPIESDTRKDGAKFTDGGAESVGKTTYTRWEYFTGNDEGGCIGTKVEEELGNNNKSKASTGSNPGVGTSKDTEHESGDEETLDLDPLAAQNLNESDSKEVTWNVTGDSNNQIALSIMEEILVWGFAGRISNISQDDRLIQIDSVKGNID